MGKDGHGDVRSGRGNEQQAEVYRILIANYEEKQGEQLEENQLLRRSLYDMQSELISITNALQERIGSGDVCSSVLCREGDSAHSISGPGNDDEGNDNNDLKNEEGGHPRSLGSLNSSSKTLMSYRKAFLRCLLIW